MIIIPSNVATGIQSDPSWSSVTLSLKNIGINGATNSSFRDDSPYNFLPTRTGDVTQGTFSPFGALTGTADATAVGGSVWFDGPGDSSIDCITFPASTQFDLGTGDFTVEAWINLNSSTVGAIISTYNGWWFQYRSDNGGLCFGNADTFVATAPFTAFNQWAHVAATRSGTSLKIFVNGVQSGSTVTNSTNFSSNSNLLRIGSLLAANSGFDFNGYISNLRIVKGTALYTGSFTPSSAPLTAISGTVLLTCQSATSITDASSNAFTATKVGDGVVPNPAAPFGFGSAYFDGTGDYLEPAAATAATNFGTGDFTAEFWYYPVAAGQQNCLDNFGNGGVALYRDTSGYMNYYIGGNVISSTTALSNNTWWHVALVRSSGSSKLYINGAKEGVTYTDSTNFAGGAAYPRIGTAFNGAVGVNGYMSNVRIVKNAVYTANFTPPTAPLTAITGTSLLTCQDKGRIADASSNGFAITRAGDVRPVGESPFAQKQDGRWSNYFDGSGDSIIVAANAARNVGTSGDFTVEGWFNISTIAFSTYYNILWQSTDYNGIKLTVSGANGTLLLVGLNDALIFASSTVMPLNQWVHVAAVRYNGTITLYFNGVSVGSANNSSATSSMAGAIYIGSQNNAGGWITGYVSNFRMTTNAVYTSAFTPPVAPLSAVAGTTALVCRDNRLMDASSYNLSVTKTGDVAVSQFNPFGASGVVATTNLASAGSVYFDGTGDWLSMPSNAAFGFGTGDYTIEAWINPASWSTNYVPLFRHTVSGGISFSKGYNANTLIINKIGTGDLITSSTLPATGAWTHVVAVRSGTTLSIFVNGARTATATDSSNIPTSDAYIGGPSDGSVNSAFNGYISNVRVVKGTAVYDPTQTTLAVPTSPLTAISGTSLLTAQDAVTVTDASSNAFTVTKVGDAKAHEATPFKRVTYPYGGSAYFDGASDYVSVTNNSYLEIGASDFTLEFWVYPVVLGYEMWACNYGGANGFAVGTRSGVLWWLFGTGAGWAFERNASVGATAKAWNHIAITRSSGTARLFLNGVLVDSVANSSTLVNGSSLTFGGFVPNSYWSNSYMSNVRIVKGSAIYTANFTPPTSPVTAVGGTTLLLNFDNAGAYDSSGNVNIQSLGDAKTSTSVVKYGLASNSFDGTGDRLWTNKLPGNFDLQGQFTVEAWVNFTATAGKINYIFNYLNDVEAGWMLRYVNTGALRFFMGGSNFFDRSWTAALNTWYHVAVARDSSNNIRLFIDGVQQGAAVSISVDAIQSQYGLQIGGVDLQGFVEDARVTKGVARYSGNFTVPSASFPTK